MPADSGYKEARAISEAAREKDWKLPSFGKGLYLGHLQLDLISPKPGMPADAVEKGERFLSALGAFLKDEVDPQAIERDDKIPGEVIAGFKDLGALGMKVPEEYGGPGDGPMVPPPETDQGIPAAAGATTAGSSS